ncbi:copia protein, partial [Tanacetum coccineum]
QAFNDLRKKLIESPILVVPNWDYDFEIMCDASDFALGAVLGQRKDKHFHPIHYASKTMTGAQLHYTTTEKEMLAVVYADSDHAGDYVDRKSTSAEYVSVGKACQQALWMKQALIDYDIRLNDVPIMCDNKGAIDLSKNLMQHSRTKHIEIRHHFLRDNVQKKGHVSIEKVPSADNIADILTKPLKRESFNYLRLGLGMMEHIP